MAQRIPADSFTLRNSHFLFAFFIDVNHRTISFCRLNVSAIRSAVDIAEQYNKSVRARIAIAYSQFPNVLKMSCDCLRTCYYTERLAWELTSVDVVCFCWLFVQNITIRETKRPVAVGVLSRTIRAAHNGALHNARSISLCSFVLKADALSLETAFLVYIS